MSDPSAPLPPSIAFTSTADEVTRFPLIAWRSFARAVPSNVYWIVVLGMFVVIGFAVLAAQKTGAMSTAEVPPVLLAAYLSYGCGAALDVRSLATSAGVTTRPIRPQSARSRLAKADCC